MYNGSPTRGSYQYCTATNRFPSVPFRSNVRFVNKIEPNPVRLPHIVFNAGAHCTNHDRATAWVRLRVALGSEGHRHGPEDLLYSTGRSARHHALIALLQSPCTWRGIRPGRDPPAGQKVKFSCHLYQATSPVDQCSML
jgi:hypothetical protein